MKINFTIVFLVFCIVSFSQEKKGTIKVAKNTVSGLYLYEADSGTRTYIRIFNDSSVMLANNNEDPDYMVYWFDQMSRNSNLPHGKLIFTGEEVNIELRVAQSREDNIHLRGTFIEPEKLKLRRIGEGVDNKDYIFNKL